MVRFRMYFDKDRETEWLNEMSAGGYAMKDFCMGVYRFEKCLPGEYSYQVDISNRFFDVDEAYAEFMKEVGVEIVCMWGFWVILRKKAADGPFCLYSDVESSIEHYTRIRRLFKAVTVLEIICLWIILLTNMTAGSLTVLGYFFVVLAIVAVMIRQVMRVNGILAELKARIGKPLDFPPGNRRLSAFLVWGLLLNSIGILLSGWEVPFGEPVRGILQLLAVALMGAGLVRTFIKSR